MRDRTGTTSSKKERSRRKERKKERERERRVKEEDEASPVILHGAGNFRKREFSLCPERRYPETITTSYVTVRINNSRQTTGESSAFHGLIAVSPIMDVQTGRVSMPGTGRWGITRWIQEGREERYTWKKTLPAVEVFPPPPDISFCFRGTVMITWRYYVRGIQCLREVLSGIPRNILSLFRCWVQLTFRASKFDTDLAPRFISSNKFLPLFFVTNYLVLERCRWKILER